jgi:hypothetical protein
MGVGAAVVSFCLIVCVLIKIVVHWPFKIDYFAVYFAGEMNRKLEVGQEPLLFFV